MGYLHEKRSAVVGAVAMYGSPPIKSLEKHKWNIRIVRAKINSEKIELETSYEKSNEI